MSIQEVNLFFSREIKRISSDFYGRLSISCQPTSNLLLFLNDVVRADSPMVAPNAPVLFVLTYYRQEIFKQAIASVFNKYGPFLDKQFGDLDDYVDFLERLNQSNHVFTFLMTLKDSNEEYQALTGPDSMDLAEHLKIRFDLFFKQVPAYLCLLEEMQSTLRDRSFAPDGTFLSDDYERHLTTYALSVQNLLAAALRHTGLPPTDPLYVRFQQAGQDYFLTTTGVLKQQMQLKHDVTTLDDSLYPAYQRFARALSKAYHDLAAVKPSVTPVELPKNRVAFSNWLKQLKKTATLVNNFPEDFLSSLINHQVITHETGVKWADELRGRGIHITIGQKENHANSKNVL